MACFSYLVLSLNKILKKYYLVFALSGLSRVKRGDGMKKVEKTHSNKTEFSFISARFP